MKTFITLFIALILFPLRALAVDPATFSSKILGVQLWAIGSDDHKFPYESFDKVNEFTRYCDGKRSIYVSLIDTPVPCKTTWIDKYTYKIMLISTDRRLSGLAVISKSPISLKSKPDAISTEELVLLRAAEKKLAFIYAADAKQKYIASQSENTKHGHDLRDKPEVYLKVLNEIKSEVVYLKYAGQRYKLATPNGFFYISAIGSYPDEAGWNMKNAVFREIDGAMTEVGRLDGCILGFRDLNGDGTPEVLATVCDQPIATTYTFWSMTPIVTPVVLREQ